MCGAERVEPLVFDQQVFIFVPHKHPEDERDEEEGRDCAGLPLS